MPSFARKMIIALLIIVVYTGIPLLILTGFINFDYKFYALTLGAVVVYVTCRICGFANANMGITSKNVIKSMLYVLPITILIAISGIILWIGGYSRIIPNEKWSFFIFYIVISSPIQEFLYRGVLDLVLEEFKIKKYARIIISSILYSFVHIIYKDALTLVLTFAIGLIWHYFYQKTKNLVGVSLSHAVLGLITILAGIIN